MANLPRMNAGGAPQSAPLCDRAKGLHILRLHMSRPFRQTVLVLIAFGMLAAQTVCACPLLKKSSLSPSPVSQKTCTGTGKCCMKHQSPVPSPSRPTKQWPCEKCNLMHPADEIQPDRFDTAAVTHHVYLTLAPVPPFIAVRVAGLYQTRGEVERVPIPPLLQDLFHAGTLLLI